VSTPDPILRGRCPACGRVVQLRTMDKSRTYRLVTPLIARHLGAGAGRRAQSRITCIGSGQKPLGD
jgi:hypothetical protein